MTLNKMAILKTKNARVRAFLSHNPIECMILRTAVFVTFLTTVIMGVI